MTQAAHLNQPFSPGSLVMITGATGGLGKVFALDCASRGWDLFLTDLSPQKLEGLAMSLRRMYRIKVITWTGDLTEPDTRAELSQYITQNRLIFWSLFNVAGLDFEGSFMSCSLRQIRTILRLNIEGTLEVTHNLLGRRDPLAAFRVINVASLAAFYPMPVKATYAASKRFLLDFSLALREELRPIGATVTVLCPAGLPTTPECIRAIEAQGLLGQVTTQNVGSVAAETVNAALRGKAVVIPGLINRFICLIGQLIPPQWIAQAIHARWTGAHAARAAAMIPQMETS